MTPPLPPLNEPPDDTDHHDAGHTRSQAPVSPTPPAQPRVPTNQRPAAYQQHVQQTGTRPPSRPPTAHTPAQRVGPSAGRPRRRTSLILPWWSIAAMLVLVMVVAFGIVGLFVALGSSRPPLQEVTPVIRIITALPTQPLVIATLPSSVPLITLGNGSNSGGQLALEGPTLAVVLSTPTPIPITIGSTVVVAGVDADQLNVRDLPAVQGTNILFRANEGSFFTIISGPQQGDNFVWWQIQDALNPANVGWAVANFLQVTEGGQ